MTHTPSDVAMRFVVKWSRALRLDPFGCQILAKAIDTEFPSSTEAIEAGAVQGLVAFARAHDAYMLASGYEGPESKALHPNAAANWKQCRAALSQLAEASNG